MNEAMQIIIGGLFQGSVFAILALGFSLVYRVTGVINLAQGAFCVLGALIMYTLEQTLAWPPALAAVGAVVATSVFGLALAAAIFVRALARLPNSSVLMLTAALLTMIGGLALVVWGNEPYALPPFSGEVPANIFGLDIPTQGFWIAGVALIMIAMLWYLLIHTKLGKALRACAENPMAARLMGIDVVHMTLLSFVLSAFIGAIAGVVVAPIISIQFDSGNTFTIAGFIAVAIGGMSSFVGSVLGGLFLGVAEQLAAGYVSSLFSNTVAVGLLLVTLLWRPNGLFAARTGRHDTREYQRAYRAIVRLKGGGALLFGCVTVVVALALPWLLSEGLLSTLVIVGILFIAMLGLDVLMGFAGQINLGQAGFMAIGGYTAAILATRYGLSPLVGTFAGIALSLACAAVLSGITMRLRGFYLALATLAFGLLVDSLAVGLTQVTGGPSGLAGIPSFALGSFVFDTPLSMYYFLVLLLAVLVVVLLGGINSSFGRALQAIRADQTAAIALGINVAGYKMAAFAISAGFGSLAGSLYAFYFHFLSPDMVGMPQSFVMIAMLVVGGEGTLVGSLFGVALLTLLPTIFQPLALYKTFAQGALLALAFLYLPEGIFGGVAGWLVRMYYKLRYAGRLPFNELAPRDDAS